MHRTLLALVLGLVLVVVGGCGSDSSTTSGPSKSPDSATPPAPASPTTTAALPPLVGQWQITQTCPLAIRVLRRAHRLDLAPYVLGNVLLGWDDGPPSDWNPRRPCRNAMPPHAHSHTFWADGTFNSYDENGQEVDENPYELVDRHSFRFSPLLTMRYEVSGDTLTMTPIVPENCTKERIVGVEDGRDVSCLEAYGWAFSVAWPGARWARVTSGPHVPPGTGTSG